MIRGVTQMLIIQMLYSFREMTSDLYSFIFPVFVFCFASAVYVDLGSQVNYRGAVIECVT